MTADDFRAWLAHMGTMRGKDRPISNREAARTLGWSRTAVERVVNDGKDAPLYIALACSAVLHGLPPWRRN